MKLIFVLFILLLISPVSGAFLNLSVQDLAPYATTANLSSTNNTMKSYVDGQISAIPPGGSGDTSSFAFINGTRPFTRLNVSSNVSGITTIIGMDDAVNKSWVSMGGCPRCFAVPIVSDFYDPSTQAIPGFLGAAISSGVVASVATTADHPGVITMRDSTTAAGGYRYGCGGTQLLSGNEYYEVIFQSVGVRDTQHARMGWSDSIAGATLPTDGVWFNITRVGAVTNFTGNAAVNSARTQTSTAYSMEATTWYRGTIQIDSTASTATFVLYDANNAVLWTGTTGPLPTTAGRDTSPCIIVSETTTDAAAGILNLDYVRWADVKARVR